MVLDIISTCLVFMGSGAAFGLSFYLLLYLGIPSIRQKLEGKLPFGLFVSALIPALCVTPFVINKIWFYNFQHLDSYLQSNPTCPLDRGFVDSEGYAVGSWSLDRYREYSSNDLKEERKVALEKIGFIEKCSSNPNFI